MTYPIPADEQERLSDLKSYFILDSAAESDFDAIVHLASSICEVPYSLVTFLDEERQWFKARVGVNISETPRDVAFCSHAIRHNSLMIVPDATKDDRFKNNPMVTGDPDIRFYAGMPLITPAGHNLGTICVLDSKPRQLSEQQKSALRILGKQIINLLELRRKNLQLQRLSETNKRILSIIGHDLKSPFNSLNGILYLLGTSDLSIDEFKEMAAKIRTTVDSGSHLLKNLLEWASSQAEGQNLNKKSICLKKLVDKVMADHAQPLLEKGNALVNKVSADHYIYSDENMTEFIIRNLVLNANKFTKNGVITSDAKAVNGYIEISISDTGVGMELNVHESLFTWNKRITTEGTNGEKGSGLGLLFCKEFIEAHEGRIWASTSSGSTFHFTLPRGRLGR